MSNLSEKVDNDELAAFVATTLKAIKAGIDEASLETIDHRRGGYSTFEVPAKVEFDVAVTARRSAESGGGLKVQVFSVGGQVGGKSEDHSETVSRIQFSVPWRYTSTSPIPAPPRGSTV